MKLILEVLPLVVFFTLYRFYGMVEATAGLVIISVIGIGAYYLRYKTVSKTMVISTVLVAVLGGITVISGNSSFIKIKPTIFSVGIAIILGYGLFRKKYYLRSVLGSSIKMPDKLWHVLTKRFILFFLFLGIVNEIIWRLFSEEFWVLFKVFGVLGMTMVFMLSQIPLLRKHISE